MCIVFRIEIYSCQGKNWDAFNISSILSFAVNVAAFININDTGKLVSDSNDSKLEFSKIVKIVGNAESWIFIFDH